MNTFCIIRRFSLGKHQYLGMDYISFYYKVTDEANRSSHNAKKKAEVTVIETPNVVAATA
jgi:hypothetical protein